MCVWVDLSGFKSIINKKEDRVSWERSRGSEGARGRAVPGGGTPSSGRALALPAALQARPFAMSAMRV